MVRESIWPAPGERNVESELTDLNERQASGPKPETRVVIALLRAVDDLRAFFTRIVRPLGLTPQQYNVLRILRGAGAAGLPTLEIGDRMIERSPGITGLVDRLVTKGFVKRIRSRKDRRQVLCRLTEEGRVVLAELDQPVSAADSTAMALLTPDELEQLVDSLNKISASLEDGAQPHEQR